MCIKRMKTEQTFRSEKESGIFKGVSEMTQKRLLVIYGILLSMLAVVVGRLYLLAGNSVYAGAAQNQMVTTLTLDSPRGNFYDTNGVPLTGYQKSYYALSIPGESGYTQLFQYAIPSEQAKLYQHRNSTEPFLVQVDRDLSEEGIYTYTRPKRTLPDPIAPHLLGYLDSSGHGVSGLEGAYDDLLTYTGEASCVQCVTTAQGHLLQNGPQYLPAQGEAKGIRLTLDSRIQRICEGAAQQSMTSGCILVLESDTGKVLSSVSVPEFDPENLEKSIHANDTSMLNRAFCSFNVGSVFKPVLAAAALEKKQDDYTCQCKGYVDLNHHIYRCAKGIAHGETNLQTALEESCNCYFIELGLRMGGEPMRRMAQNLGFGQAQFIGGGLKTQAGNLPKLDQLQNLGQLASVSFGQGQLMATPLQVAAMMNAIVQDGIYTSPSFLEAVIREENGEELENLYDPQVHRAISTHNAKRLKDMLIGVVEEGIGREAAPTQGGAGGKTGTAQTGRFTKEDEEKMNYWFAGFYPAQQPQYTIVVLQDDQTEPKVSSAAIFSQICNAISYLQDS